jgi:hypothetical protein
MGRTSDERLPARGRRQPHRPGHRRPAWRPSASSGRVVLERLGGRCGLSPAGGGRPTINLLVANRGEIAVRIMATAPVLGIVTVAVYAPTMPRAVTSAGPTRRSSGRERVRPPTLLSSPHGPTGYLVVGAPAPPADGERLLLQVLA